jgi:excisionase family DNA binding protein
VPRIRIKDAAVLLGVSDDTVRRWIDGGSLASFKDESGRKVIAGMCWPNSPGIMLRRRQIPSASPVPRATDSSA